MERKVDTSITAFILAIIALTASEITLLLPSLFSVFTGYSLTGITLSLILGSGPIVMGIVSLSLLKNAQKRVFMILARIFSIIAIVLGGYGLLYLLLVHSLVSSIAFSVQYWF